MNATDQVGAVPGARGTPALIEHEQRRPPVLAPRIGPAVPVPVRTGPPTADDPFRWSIVPWFEGDPGDLVVWRRARGWAVLFGAALLATGLHDDDRCVATGARTLSRVLDDEESG